MPYYFFRFAQKQSCPRAVRRPIVRSWRATVIPGDRPSPVTIASDRRAPTARALANIAMLLGSAGNRSTEPRPGRRSALSNNRLVGLLYYGCWALAQSCLLSFAFKDRCKHCCLYCRQNLRQPFYRARAPSRTFGEPVTRGHSALCGFL